jgi:outer membrane protein TolC
VRDVRRAALGEALGNTSLQVEPNPEHLLDAVDAAKAPPSGPNPEHPELRQSDAAIARAAEAERLVRVEYLPRLDLVASLWVRGSGVFDSPGGGVVPDTTNWLAGACLTWSILDIPTIRARARALAASRAVAVARRDEVALSIAGQLASGKAVLRGAVAVAEQTPKTLVAARTAEEQATARFKTGLVPVVDLADAQRVLAQAEIDDAVARLEVRRALLLVARASGDLSPFLRQSRSGAL